MEGAAQQQPQPLWQPPLQRQRKDLLWREGCMLDRLDKHLSRPIFHMVLPPGLEVVLTVPGGWFGCPIYTLGILPVLVAAAGTQAANFRHIIAGPLLVGGVCLWLRLCWESWSVGRGISKAHRLDKKWIVVLPHVAVAVAARGSKESSTAAALYICSWHATQLIVELTRGLTQRTRPTWALADELAQVKRAMPEMLALGPSQEHRSFPSGDAAGGATFASSLMIVEPRLRRLATLVLLLTGAGRVYFHAHHVLDVVVGQVLGMTVTFVLSNCGRLDWRHIVFAQLVTLLLWLQAQKLRPDCMGKKHEHSS